LTQKPVTTYNEVADELVQEYCDYSSETVVPSGSTLDYWSYDQKNVRRRVYDALNVFRAMNIISKEKKEIKWFGLPCNKKQECQELELERQNKTESVKRKREQLKQLVLEVSEMREAAQSSTFFNSNSIKSKSQSSR
jgi:hypothetical protein